MTPNEKLKELIAELTEESIDGFFIYIIDKNGKERKYTIKNYAQMCVYTEAIAAQAEATVNIAIENDSDLVQVSSHNTVTPLCQQYEGKVFSISGNDPDFPFLDRKPPFHVNCKHSLTVIFREIIEKYGVENYL